MGKGYLLSIILPLVWLFNRAIDFLNLSYWEEVRKKIYCFIAGSALITTPLLFFLDYNIYFCFIWFMLFTVIFGFLIIIDKVSSKRIGYDVDEYIEMKSDFKVFRIVEIICGIVIFFVPQMPVYKMILGIGVEKKVVIISNIIFKLLGLSYVIPWKRWRGTLSNRTQ